MSLLKPVQCTGCPFEKTSKFFVPDEYRPGASVLLTFQNPGQDEELGRKYLWRDSVGFPMYEPHPPAPLLGPTGYLLESKYLPLAGLAREDVSLANVIRCRPNGKNDLPLVTHLTYRQAVAHCQHHYFRPPESTTLIVAAGDYALHAMTGEDGTESPGHKISRSVEGWRGWLLPYNPHPLPKMTFTDIYQPRLGQVSVLATFHIAYLWKAPWYEPCVNRDWAMVREILEGRWPVPFPRILESPVTTWPDLSAYDTEFYVKADGTSVLTRYSLRSKDGLWVVEAGDALGIAPKVGKVTPTVIFHNTEADARHLNDLLGGSEIFVEDSMHLHSVLYNDLDHDLDFLGSMHGSHNRTKHLLYSNPRVYSGGDATMTWDAWHDMQRSLARDPQSKRVYYDFQLPLIPIIARATLTGAKVNTERVKQALEALSSRQKETIDRAQASVGWPMNLNSTKYLLHRLYEVEKIHLNKMTGREIKE